MAYKTAQVRFEIKAERTKLLGAFYRNLAILAREQGRGAVELNQNTAAIAGRCLLFVEGLTSGFREEYKFTVEQALLRMANADRGFEYAGVYPNERALLRSAVTATFVQVTAGADGDIVRQDDRAEWALGLDGIGIVRAAAYALLNSEPRA